MTHIQWTDETWNPVTGCTRVSEGCRHCYIERTIPFRLAGRKFVNGTTGIQLHPDRLDQPRHWRKPRRVFVNSLSDLFHEDIPREFLKAVVGVTVDCPQHTFQILTKRPERMREFCRECAFPSNVWMGVSVEDQPSADKRIPILLQTPAAVRWVSAEPLLEPVNVQPWLRTMAYCNKCGHYSSPAVNGGLHDKCNYFAAVTRRLDWVVIGGESGPGARPCNLAWIRAIVEQCQAARVPCFVKQLGSTATGLRLRDHKGGNPSEWPEDLRVRKWPDLEGWVKRP